MWKRRAATTFALAGVVFLLFLFARPSFRSGQADVAGKTAPNFQFTLNGEPTSLAAMRGKVVVLNFWATWCPPCIAETPALERMYSQLEPLGVTVLGVSVDDDAEAYRKFLVDNHISFPTYRDPSKRISLTYGTKMYPETYIIGRDGKIERKLIGEQDWNSPQLMGYLRDVAEGKQAAIF